VGIVSNRAIVFSSTFVSGASMKANTRFILVTTVRSTLQHPLMQRAAGAKSLKRETPLQHYREDGTLIEGVVDLTFEEDDTSVFKGWTVVDFKTHREIENAENQYRAQVAAYVEAIRVATASPARGFVLVV
jgi:ATP-dependent helicase/nuclease subunit A